MSHTKHNYSD